MYTVWIQKRKGNLNTIKWKCKSTNLNKIIKDAKTFRIFTALDINKGSNLWSSKGDMLIPHYNFKLLPPNTVRFWPVDIIFLQDLKIGKNVTNLGNQDDDTPLTKFWEEYINQFARKVNMKGNNPTISLTRVWETIFTVQFLFGKHFHCSVKIQLMGICFPSFHKT